MYIHSDSTAGHIRVGGMSTGNCLIVENDPAHQEVICLIMENLSLPATTTHYSTDLYEQIERFSPPLIVLDLEFGSPECWELLRSLQCSEATRDIPLVCLSTSDEVLDNARERFDFPGGARFLQKPFDVNEMEVVIQALLGSATDLPPS